MQTGCRRAQKSAISVISWGGVASRLSLGVKDAGRRLDDKDILSYAAAQVILSLKWPIVSDKNE